MTNITIMNKINKMLKIFNVKIHEVNFVTL